MSFNEKISFGEDQEIVQENSNKWIFNRWVDMTKKMLWIIQ